VYHASVGPDRLGATFVGTEEIRKGARIFFERFPDGKFENLKVVVSGTFGTFEWDFVASDATGKVGHDRGMRSAGVSGRYGG
jgi:hypothetical protein